MSENLSVNGSGPNKSNKQSTVEQFVIPKTEFPNSVLSNPPKVELFAGEGEEFLDSVSANSDITMQIFKSGECSDGRLPDGSDYRFCPGGIFTQRTNGDRYEAHVFKATPNGFKDYYTILGKGSNAVGCIDQDGNKCDDNKCE